MTRAEAIEHLKTIAIYSFQDGYTDEARQAIDTAIKALEEPERKKGRWIVNNGLYQCSACKHIFSELWWVSACPIDRMNEIMCYCPKCGCRMGKE